MEWFQFFCKKLAPDLLCLSLTIYFILGGFDFIMKSGKISIKKIVKRS